MTSFRGIVEPKPRELPPLPNMNVSSQFIPMIDFDAADDVIDARTAAYEDNHFEANDYWPSSSQVIGHSYMYVIEF